MTDKEVKAGGAPLQETSEVSAADSGRQEELLVGGGRNLLFALSLVDVLPKLDGVS